MAVKAGEVACPFAFVTAVAVVWLLKVPLGPDAGAVNVTVTLGTAFPTESLTATTKKFVKGLLTSAL